MKYRPPTIEEIGLKEYLNQTATTHNNSDYEEFVKRVELNEPSTIIARAFGVDRRTVTNWIVIYEKGLSHES